MKLIKNNRLAFFSLILIFIFIIIAIFAPIISPYDPYAQSLSNRLVKPGILHLLGTDELGRDVFSRLIYGSRISLLVGLLPTFISLVIGTVLGLISGYYGNKIDFCIMRLADIILAFPSLLFAMLITYTIGAGLLNIFIALAFINWASTARIIRATTLSLKEKEYVLAAKSMGVNDITIMLRHILPNCFANLIVLFTLNIPSAILAEASLSFLGVGAKSPSASLGLMVVKAKKYLFTNPNLVLAPSILIMIFVLLFNFLGDGLRDILDPQIKDN